MLRYVLFIKPAIFFEPVTAAASSQGKKTWLSGRTYKIALFKNVNAEGFNTKARSSHCITPAY
jgi:hypothetical protein